MGLQVARFFLPFFISSFPPFPFLLRGQETPAPGDQKKWKKKLLTTTNYLWLEAVSQDEKTFRIVGL